MFTSGTTGRSKGAIKQHASDYFSGRTYNEVCGVTADDTFFSCLPLFHSNAQVLATYPAMIAGARIAFVERYSSSRFWSQVVDGGGDDPQHRQRDQLLHLEHAAAATWTAPTAVTRIMAMPAPKDIYEPLRGALRHPLHRGLRPDRDRDGHLPPAGPAPRPGQLRRRDARLRGPIVVEPGTDLPVPPGTPGEIVVDMKMPNIVMRTYAGMPEKTAEDFRNLKLHTGDLGQAGRGGLPLLPRPGEGLHPPPRRERQLDGGRGASFTSHAGRAGGRRRRREGAARAPRPRTRSWSASSPATGCATDPAALLDWCDERMPYFAVPRYVRVMDHLPEDARPSGCARWSCASRASRPTRTTGGRPAR